MSLDPEQAGQDRRSLAQALSDLRRAAGLSGERLARRCHMSQSKVSRIENGRLLPSVVDVDRILHALEVDDATRTELLVLARVANAEYQDIRASVRRGLHHRQHELALLGLTLLESLTPTAPPDNADTCMALSAGNRAVVVSCHVPHSYCSDLMTIPLWEWSVVRDARGGPARHTAYYEKGAIRWQ